MATEEQYEFFKFLYEEEERRYGNLEARAKLYLSVIAVFLGAVLLKAAEVKSSATALGISWWVFLLEAALLAAALLFVVLGALIRSYEGVARPRDVIADFGDDALSNERFFTKRIADLTVATERNVKVNDQTARFLEMAGVLLASAMLLLIVIFTLHFAGRRPR